MSGPEGARPGDAREGAPPVTPASLTPMTPERLARVRELFDAALEVTFAERAGFLRRACGADVTLRQEVESLLAALDRSEDTWERPVGELLATALHERDDAAAVGTRIGPYEITRLVGVGGMGAVYEGVRADDQFHKRVALKFLRRGHEGDLAIRRFRYERQILANLSHKNIAALLDGGVTPDGQPYIVMEYVDGRPITAYARSRNLGVRERVQLLRQVAAAVQHAHQNLVVHRDLKPGNILVAADGTVKLLDFGIARLLREMEGPDQLPATQGGMAAFTPDYASPEQVRGQPVATSSDLYSLGVIACELLSGHRPFNFDGQLFSEMQARICLAPPPPPSSLATVDDAPHFGVASLAQLQRQLRGDLDAIVLQALRKEPERRYSSAEQFAGDLQRHLDGLPVSARRDTLGYRTRKFLRRRRFEVAAGTLVAASLVGGIVATARQARRAETERAKTAQVNQFLATMLAAVDPGNSGRDVTVAQVLSQAARDIEQRRLAPEIEAQIRHTLGQTYVGLALYDSAEVHVRRAAELRQRELGLLHQSTSMSLSYVAALEEARGNYAAAESTARIVLDLQRRITPRLNSELATAIDNVSRYVEQQGRLDEARRLSLESIAIRRASGDSATMYALPFTLNSVAISYQYEGMLDSAEAVAREAVETEARLNGRRTQVYANVLRTLAGVLDSQKRLAEADSLVREAIDVLREVAGETHPDYLRSVTMLAGLQMSARDWPSTERSARMVVAAIGTALHESHPQAAVALQTLGIALSNQGKVAGADSALRWSLALREKYLPPEHWALASSRSVLGHHLAMTGRVSEGEPMLRRAYDALVATRGADADPTLRTAERLAEVLVKTARPAEAARWRRRAVAAPDPG